MGLIACRKCISADCHGCNMYSLERMLMSGKLDVLMNENHAIKTDVDVRPVVKSHWVDNRVAFYRGCSKCGAFVCAIGKLKFCPNCGADMREGYDAEKTE